MSGLENYSSFYDGIKTNAILRQIFNNWIDCQWFGDNDEHQGYVVLSVTKTLEQLMVGKSKILLLSIESNFKHKILRSLQQWKSLHNEIFKSFFHGWLCKGHCSFVHHEISRASGTCHASNQRLRANLTALGVLVTA